MITLDDLDRKALDHFRGFVVKKDLVGIIKGGANVPAFVLEYLLANTCSTEDEEKLKEGMENVKSILRDHYINPEESSLIQSKLREKGRYKIIDKIQVELDPQRDRYWAYISNSNIKKDNISDELVKNHEKLLLGGIWAIIEMEYDPMITVGNTVYPFLVRDIKPIQLSTFDNSKISNVRKEFTKFVPMKNISKKTLIFLTLFLSFTLLNFYSYGQKSWVNDIHNEEMSLYEIQESFENYWEGKVTN